MDPIDAGNGEHHVYKIAADSADSAKLTARNHYLGVDAVSWFVNKESSWFKDRMASGAISIKLSSGLEEYHVALGTFALETGTRRSPIFDRPALPDRNYRGGPLTFFAQLSSVKSDTALSGILKSAASASLGVVSGMVATATVTGPSKLLGAAGQAIIDGVRTLLTSTGDNREPLFDFNGIEYTIQPEEIVGPQIFLLLHRGSELVESNLTVVSSGKLLVPAYEGSVLEDGAWLLLRIRRSDEYSGVRDWYEAEKQMRLRITNLVDDYFIGSIAKDTALAEFASTTSGGKTILDEYIRLRTVIGSDGVISEREAGYRAGQLRVRIDASKRAITADNRQLYDEAIKGVNEAIGRGVAPKGPLGQAFLDDVTQIAALRTDSLDRNTMLRRVADFAPSKAVESMMHMQRLVADFSRSDKDLA